MKRYWRKLFYILVLVASAILVTACGSLPSLENRSTSTVLTDTTDTRLSRSIAPQLAAHPGKSGIYPLSDAHDAFAARALLARAAERSLNVQYYIWQQDLSGTLLLEAVRAAAERGVRVRMLLDDNGVAGLDATMAALNAHPNVEIRLFNPFAIRSPRWINYLTDFSRLNRRMHNKSFTADNQATIVGGRNVGDEYFGATAGMVFADLDVLAVGPVVDDVSQDFDRYWTSASSYPVDRLLAPADPAALAELASAASLIERDARAAAYVNALRNTAFVRELTEGQLDLEWVTVRLVSDDPAKGLGLAEPEALMPDRLKQIVGSPATELALVSPYFVPAVAGTDAFRALAGQGVNISALTNSLESTDVAAVHAGYAKRRKPLLEAGVILYETKKQPSPERERGANIGPFGSSSASLHAKTFAVDRARVFIGSFNFDPRSANLNTEMGFIIDSPALAKQIAAAFTDYIPANAYRVCLSESGKLYWIERRNGEVIRHDTEPGTSVWQRVGVWFLTLLPIDWLL